MVLTDEFHKYVTAVIDEKGVFPLPGMSMDRDGKLHMAALMEPYAAFNWFWNEIANKQASQVIFGLDRSTKDGQGTEFRDVMTCAYWADGLDDKPWISSFRIGVINYQYEPRIVRPFDFENEFWIETMSKELRAFCWEMRIRLECV